MCYASTRSVWSAHHSVTGQLTALPLFCALRRLHSSQYASLLLAPTFSHLLCVASVFKQDFVSGQQDYKTSSPCFSLACSPQRDWSAHSTCLILCHITSTAASTSHCCLTQPTATCSLWLASSTKTSSPDKQDYKSPHLQAASRHTWPTLTPLTARFASPSYRYFQASESTSLFQAQLYCFL